MDMKSTQVPGCYKVWREAGDDTDDMCCVAIVELREDANVLADSYRSAGIPTIITNSNVICGN